MPLLSFLQQHISLEDIPTFAITQGIGSLLYEELAKRGEHPFDTISFMKLRGCAEKQEKEWQIQKDNIARLSRFCQKHNLQALIFKGYSLSLLYDNPLRRKSGDLDVYFFTHNPQTTPHIPTLVDELVRQKGKSVTPGTKHTSFQIRTTHVENHHHFVGTEEHPRLQPLEDYLLTEIQDRKLLPSEEWPNIYYPSPNFNAAFLPLHFGEHFVYEGATLRQLMDWVTFLHTQGPQVDWPSIHTLSAQCGYHRWLQTINTLAATHFSIPPSIPPSDYPTIKLSKVINALIHSQPIDRHSRTHTPIRYALTRTTQAIRDRWQIKLVFDESPLTWYLRHAKNYLTSP